MSSVNYRKVLAKMSGIVLQRHSREGYYKHYLVSKVNRQDRRRQEGKFRGQVSTFQNNALLFYISFGTD
jgi:hypothetical protein